MVKKCYFRVDANNKIGTGHLVRTEILADELFNQNIEINFICKDLPGYYEKHLIKKNYKIYKINNNKSELEQILKIIINKHSILIVDSDKSEFYTKEFQTGIKEKDIKLMIITFYHNHHFYADIILNQNIMALSQKYSCEDYTIKLLGPKIVILKNEYRKIAKNLNKYKTNLPNRTVLLTFGGVDEPDRTSYVYKALLNCKYQADKIIIILGAMYKNKEKIVELSKNSAIKTEIYQNTPKMPYLLAESDIVFNSGGLTVWEAGVFNNLIVIMGHSEREQLGGKYIGDNEYGIYLGTKDNYTIESLSKKIEHILSDDNNQYISKLSEAIDVNGIEKVVNTIKSL